MPGAQAEHDLLLGSAGRIGDRLVRDAIRDELGCRWQIMTPDQENPESGVAVPKEGSGALYEGSAGIALFLAELHRKTGCSDLAETARGALDFALHDASTRAEDAFGFHTGRVGIAYAAVRAGAQVGVDLRTQAASVLLPLVGNEGRDRGLDVIAGAAGAIPALLWLSEHLDREITLDLARGLADHLVASARKDPHGWSWGSLPTATRNLCGYSHGASGMAHALLEMYRATGDGEYRYGAEQALLYERQFLSQEQGNWPDFRHKVLGEYLADRRMSELRERLLAGDSLEPAETTYVRFWCHGAPGIGLARLHAYKMLGWPQYLDDARIALRTTLESIESGATNYSLCHGVGGNCETLLLAARVLGEMDLQEKAMHAALAGVERYDESSTPWPCGTLGGVSDPGLMLGEAGIGLFLLRVADPSVESVLLTMGPDGDVPGTGSGRQGYQRARMGAVNAHFGRTLRRFAHLGAEPAFVPREGWNGPDVSDVSEAYAALRASVDDAEPALGSLLADAFRLDEQRYQLLLSCTDQTQEFLERLARRAPAEMDWGSARLRLGPRVRLVDTTYDWDAQEPVGPEVEPSEVSYVIWHTSGHTLTHRLKPLGSAVLRSLVEPGRVDEVEAQLSAAFPDRPTSTDLEWFSEQVRKQVMMAYHNRLIVEDMASPSPKHDGGSVAPPDSR